MSYRLEWKGSPNFTPGSQTKAFYGRPRTIEMGAGHWWDDPSRGPSHSGVVNTFLNPARQASAHAVVSAGLVTEMVRQGDTAWCTNSANPYTYAIEVDPRITQGGQVAEDIMKTLTEYIADKGFHNLDWKPHKFWFSTACNPIGWGEVMRRAKLEYAAKHAPAPPAVPEWKRNLRAYGPTKLRLKAGASGHLLNLNNVNEAIKTLPQGTQLDVKGITSVGGHNYLLSAYAMDNGQANGVREWEFEQIPPPTPEWLQNLVDVEDVKLMVLPAEGTQVVHLLTGANITPLAKGTWVDIAKKTVVGGKTYLISKYSVENVLPNGILQEHLGVPVVVPPVTKPEWLEKWEDIADVTMYTRVKAPLVNLLDGSTVKEIEINQPIEVASTTEWHGQKYAITKYSTDKKEARGIALVNLDKDPIKEPETPVEPDPEKPVEDLIRENNNLLKQILALVQWIFNKLGGK